MSVVDVNHVTRYFGTHAIIADASFALEAGEHAGLIGRNGQGKTTLLRLLAGQDEPDGGTIRLSGDLTVGFLSQDIFPEESVTLYEFALHARSDLFELENQLRVLEKQLARMGEQHGADVDELVAEYDRCHLQYERSGGYTHEADTHEVLAGLGFSDADLELELEHLSGGQRVRAALGCLLLQAPGLLLLDEPTNHLDLEATEWLESYLRDYGGTVVVVSHDRYFLDQVAHRVFEIERGRLMQYNGNYSAYERQREHRRVEQAEEYRKQQEEIEKLKDFIRRYKAGQRTRQARAREHQLERMDLVETPLTELPVMVLDFSPDRETGFEVCWLKGISKAFGDNCLFHDVSATVYKGQKIGILGPNGSGKSTLLKLLWGNLYADEGSIRWGVGVQRAYFEQELNDFDYSRSVIDEFRAYCDLNIPEARSFLAGFLFRGDEVFKTVSQLSGGERNRLQLAKLVVSGANVLLLDEPTNHLDIPSREALEEALREFPGTVFFVTHDRFLLNRVADHVWDVSDGRVAMLQGNYNEWRAKRGNKSAQSGSEEQRLATKDRRPQAGGARHETIRPAISTYRLNREIEALEQEIAALEQRRKEHEALLTTPETYQRDDVGLLVKTFHETSSKLDELYDRWVQYTAELDNRGTGNHDHE